MHWDLSLGETSLGSISGQPMSKRARDPGLQQAVSCFDKAGSSPPRERLPKRDGLMAVVWQTWLALLV